MADRHCFGCGDVINACMGTVNAGDWLKLTEGLIPASAVRELCPKCATAVVNHNLLPDESTAVTELRRRFLEPLAA